MWARVAVVTVAGGAVAAWGWRRWQDPGSASTAGESRGRWLAVTIDRPLEEILVDGSPPEPLARFGDDIEFEARQAPGDKGSELRARLRHPASQKGGLAAQLTGSDPRQEVRTALRQAKQILETGEVLRVDPAPHGPRSDTPGDRLVSLFTRRAGGEGLL